MDWAAGSPRSQSRTPARTAESGAGAGGKPVAGFLNWASFEHPTRWNRRFFVLHDGWLYRFPNANVKVKPEAAIRVNGGIVDTPDTHPIVAASQMSLFRITTRDREVVYFHAASEEDMMMWVKPLISASMLDLVAVSSPRDSVAFEQGQAAYQAATATAGEGSRPALSSPLASQRSAPIKSSNSTTPSPEPASFSASCSSVNTTRKGSLSPVSVWTRGSSSSALPLTDARVKALRLRATARDVIRLQALFRGRLARKRYAEIKELARKRRNVVEEIAQTEKNYVSLLLTTIEVIFEPLQKLNARLDTAQSNQTRLDLNVLHTNSQRLYKMHARFAECMTAAVQNYTHHLQLGVIFNDVLLASGVFSAEYQQYVVNYETAVKSYQQSLSFHTYKSFFDVAITHYRCNALDFCSLLISPVQRIPRYVLLLKELFKFTWPEHGDYAPLKLAMTNISQIAEDVNEAKRKAEGVQRTLSIQTKLDDRKLGRGLSARRYVREGILSQLVKGQQPRERYVFLFSDQLISSLKKTVRMGLNNSTVRFSSKGAISLLNTEVVRSAKDEAVFTLRSTTTGRSAQAKTKWRANNKRECDSWVQDIALLLAELKQGD